MEDSAVVFEEFRNTAGVMEEEGLLPNVQKEEMEQGETGVKPTGMDIRGEEELDHSNMILKKLVDMLAPGANMPKKATEPSVLDRLVRLLRGHVVDKNPVVPVPPVLPSWNTRLKSFLGVGRMPDQGLGQRPVQRDWSAVKCFSCGNTGHSAARCPKLDITFPFMLPGWRAEKMSIGYMMISPRRAMERNRAENAN